MNGTRSARGSLARLVYVAAGLALVAVFGWVAYLAGSALAGALVKIGGAL